MSEKHESGRDSEEQISNRPPCSPRFTAIPFPASPYLPGLASQPVPEPRFEHICGELVPPDRWREASDYLYGVDLFNGGFFWEAHEVWEGLWRQAPPESVQRHFLQGFIQLAAARLKAKVGRRRGCRRLLARSTQHLGIVAGALRDDERFMGIDVHGLLSDIRGAIDSDREPHGYLLPER